jgi:hypothetical protein
MKIQFSIVLEGKESFDEKFKKSLDENPYLQIDLIKSFSLSIMMALRLNEDDKISVTSFRAGKINDQQEEKKVDS